MTSEHSLNQSELLNPKRQIKRSFGQASKRYDYAAQLQKRCAYQLLKELDLILPHLPSGDVIEIGCGTGFLTQGLVDRMGDRPLIITDLSEAMLTACQSQISLNRPSTHIQFEALDGELWQPIREKYSLIISSFAVQWFQQLEAALERWISALKPGGAILISFPTCHSFPEWKAACQQLGLPFTANPLPDPGAIAQAVAHSPVQIHYWQESIGVPFKSSLDFFRNLKQIGAGTSIFQKQLSVLEFKQLINTLDRPESFSTKNLFIEAPATANSSVCIHYEVAYFTIFLK